MVRRHELSDAAWARIEPLLPAHPRQGGRWRDHRQVINGIVWKIRTGADSLDLYVDTNGNLNLDGGDAWIAAQDFTSSVTTIPLSSYIIGPGSSRTFLVSARISDHIHDGDLTEQYSYYHRNITFELVKSYPVPPYIIIYAFFGVFLILLVLVIFGLYGDRKYQQLAQ